MKKATRVSLKVFINGINGNERCNTIYDPQRHFTAATQALITVVIKSVKFMLSSAKHVR